MLNSRAIIVVLLLAVCQSAFGQQNDRYDYYSSNRDMIRNGVQAVLTCNGLFTSKRSLEQVFKQELAYLPSVVGDSSQGNYHIDRKLKLVSVGGGEDGVQISAVFREGIGCVVMAPDQSSDDIPHLPSIKIAEPPVILSQTPWPEGDLLENNHLENEALQAASDWAFERSSPEQDTLSLLVVHKGKIIHERYAEGISKDTRTRTWSTAKSIAVTLIGMLVDQDRLSLDDPLEIEWLPKVAEDEEDPRHQITLRHLLNMSSGLYPVDSFGMEYATGSGLAYWAGSSSSIGARKRGLIREPGAFWDYENYDTLLAVHAMKLVLGEDYHQFPYQALLSKIGMHNTLLSTDRFGDFIFSSQVYTNARDLARFGLLYLQEGKWNDKQLLSKEWIKFVRTPAPSSAVRGSDYGGQWWLVPDSRTDVPKDAYATAGNRGQYVIVVPSRELVIVRRGLDYGKQGFDRWDLTREVLKALDQPGSRVEVQK